MARTNTARTSFDPINLTIPVGAATAVLVASDLGETEPAGYIDARDAGDYGFILPANFDGTLITFQVAASDPGVAGSWVALYDDANAAVGVAVVAASRAYPVPAEVAAWPYFRPVCGSNQADTDTVITFVRKA